MRTSLSRFVRTVPLGQHFVKLVYTWNRVSRNGTLFFLEYRGHAVPDAAACARNADFRAAREGFTFPLC